MIQYLDVVPAVKNHSRLVQREEVNLMRNYETVFILHPSLDEEAVKAGIEKFKGVIENGGGVIENVDFWGKRKLAYEINKINEGYYTLINFNADNELPKELDRIFRINDTVVRHLIINNEK
jgi:small subunit ribosomal protein S6